MSKHVITTLMVLLVCSLVITPAFAGSQSLVSSSLSSDNSSITWDWEFKSNRVAIESLSIQVKDGKPSNNGNPSNQFAQVYEFTEESNTMNFKAVSILTTVNGGEPLIPNTKYFLHLIVQYYDGTSERIRIGMITTTNEIIIHEEELEKPNGGGCSDCTPPTLGIDSKGKNQVNNGVCKNDTCRDAGYFYTDFPSQRTLIYFPNTVSLTYYEDGGPSNIKLVQYAIGCPEIGSPISECQVIVEVHLNHFKNDIDNPSIKEIKLIDPDGIISAAKAQVELVQCMDESGSPLCLKTVIKHSYAKAPFSTISASSAIDIPKNTFNNYFEGIDVIYHTS